MNTQEKQISASEALNKLKAGNKTYIDSTKNVGDISPEIRMYTSKNGQHPYAVIVSCSDSRVIPESIFSAGIGELFVIRVAGNVVDNFQLGSIEYAVEHLGAHLVVVLGHTGCGAVGAAHGDNSGYLKHITDEIKRAIGNETDAVRAGMLNVNNSVAKVKKLFTDADTLVIGAMYHTDSGVVDFDIS
ncbi:MAG: carbonic anhydrase [Clostridiales bacterium]|nr:carbonic anhydrase [Clostridiales bacterium]